MANFKKVVEKREVNGRYIPHRGATQGTMPISHLTTVSSTLKAYRS